MALAVLTLGTFIVGLAIFYYSDTEGLQGGYHHIQFAKLGGTIGGGLAASKSHQTCYSNSSAEAISTYLKST